MCMSKTHYDAVGTRQLPLNAIRVFVEAARAQSFSQAAKHLGMTQSGVSRHIASLESQLGIALFVRRGAVRSNAITLTDAGREYYDTVKEAITTIDFATRQVVGERTGDATLKVRTSLPSFALHVLIPALPEFQLSAGTSIDVRTSLSAPAVTDDFDVLITRDLELATPDHWELCKEMLVCVATPTLHRQFAKKSPPEWPMIAARSRTDIIAAWATSHDWPIVGTRGLNVVATYEHYFLAIAAADSGAGFIVVPTLLVANHLRNGALIAADNREVASGERYWAFVNPRAQSPKLAGKFCRWLKATIREMSSAG
jgi:LysR family transcriptional regulator, glycine cleavage system transcriptional activator